MTVYDAATRSQVKTGQDRAALRSLCELKDGGDARSVDLYFGLKAPPGKGCFVYFRIYGPEKAAFDGSWKPGDFGEVR